MSHADRQQSWSEMLSQGRPRKGESVTKKHNYGPFFSLLILKLNFLRLRNRDVTFTSIEHTLPPHGTTDCSASVSARQNTDMLQPRLDSIFFITIFENAFLYQLKCGEIFIYTLLLSLSGKRRLSISLNGKKKNEKKKKKSNTY